MSHIRSALRSAMVCSAVGIFALIAAQPSMAASIKSDGAGSDLPAGILLTRAHLGSELSVGVDSKADRTIVLATRGFSSIGKIVVAFTDLDGRPLYTLPADCRGECLTKWHPALAPANAQPIGDWSVVVREDGARQWALGGKPLFTYVKEAEFKDNLHLSYTREPPGRLQPVAGFGVDGAAVAEADPGERMKLPLGTSVVEFTQGPGMILASSATGQPLYALTGTDERKLTKDFHPYEAAMLDHPVGDFKIRTRPDGVRQWTFRGQSLFTFAGDVEAGEIHGKDLIPGLAPAVVFKFFTPKEVALQKDDKNGGRFVEAKTGQTLYVRDRIYYASISYYVPGRQRLDPLVGKAIGLSGCDKDCERDWKPLLASKDAQPRGDWTLYERPDGTKQWAYRTYAVYTHPSEPPGTLFGSETYDIEFDGGFGKKVPEEYGTGLFFRVASP